MWELLQKLEDLWWEPYWKSIAELTDTEKNVRLLTSLSSWLWQFCVENKLVKLIENPNENKCPRDRMSEEEFRMWEYNVYYSFSNKKDIHKRYEQDSLTYRLIESALKDESELDQFLLDNIKVDD